MSEYKYFAFISYKREDEKWAKWLQKKLEYYRLPSSVRKDNPDLPEKIRPIFKDTTDLSGGKLKEELSAALESSKYLIVICSPNAVKSQWINSGIQRFIELGRADKIIPFIVDGTPKSNDENECFPNALRALSGDDEILGINLKEGDADAAAVKVVARMFSLRFDVLWQRFKRAEKRQKRIIAAAVTLFIIAILSVTGWILLKNKELREKNDLIEQQYKDLETANQHIQNAADSIRMQEVIISNANDSLEVTNYNLLFAIERVNKAADSIKVQQKIISEAYDSLTQTNADLHLAKNNLERTNTFLKEANDSILKERYQMQLAQSRAVASKVIDLANSGDSYTACLLALEILPKDLQNPDRPYTIEAERALRIASYTKDVNFNFEKKPHLHLKAYISPDGKYIIKESFVEDSLVALLVDIESGQIKHKFKSRLTNDNPFAPSGKKILLTERGMVKIFDVETGDSVGGIDINQYIIGDGEKYFSTGFSHDGKRVMFQSDNSILIKDLEAERDLIIRNKFININKAEFSPTGRYIVVADYETIYILNAKNGDILHKIKSSYEAYGKFSKDESIFISTDKNLIHMWDTQNWVKKKTVKSGNEYVRTVVFNPDGRTFVSAGGEERGIKKSSHIYDIGPIRIWDAQSGKEIRQLQGHTFSVTDLSFSRDGRLLLSNSEDGDVRIWNLCNTFEKYTLRAHTTDVRQIALSPDGKKLISQGRCFYKDNKGNQKIDVNDVPLRIWDITTGDLIYSIDSVNTLYTNNLFSSDGKKIISLHSINNKIYFWDIQQQSWVYKSLSFKKGSCHVSPNAKYFILQKDMRSDNPIEVYDFNTLKRICSLNVEKGYKKGDAYYYNHFNFLTFSPDGHYIASYYNYNDENIQIWDSFTGELVKTIHRTDGSYEDLSCVAFSPDNLFVATTSLDKYYTVFDNKKFVLTEKSKTRDAGPVRIYLGDKEIFTLRGHTASVYSACFSPDGNYLVIP